MKKKFLLITLVILSYNITAQNVGIGITTPKAKLHIVGSADTTQLIIDANSTQSNHHPFIRLRNSSGNDLMWIHSDGTTNCFIGLGAGANNAGAFNTANGSEVLYTNTTGSYNTGVGTWALTFNTIGNYNTATGTDALRQNTTGNNNTATGYLSLINNYNGSDNTANGVNALAGNYNAGLNVAVGNYALGTQSYNNGGTPWSSGNTAVGYAALAASQPTSTANAINNVAVGIYALTANTIGYDNTGIGAAALYTNTVGSENTAIGRQALFYNTFGSDNAAFGYKALRTNDDGSGNTASGVSSLFSNISGNFNTANGNFALYSNTNGINNTASGMESLFSNTTGNGNTVTGAYALSNNTTGTGNTSVGLYAISNNITGSDNVGVGRYSNVDLSNSSQNTIIGASAHISGNNDVAIGYNSFTNVNNLALLGSITTSQCGGYANWSNFSDGRFKTNVEENVKGLDFILRLRPVTYHMDVRSIYKLWGISPYGKDDKISVAMKTQTDNSIKNKEAIRMSGFIAQEVEKAANDAGYDFDGVIKPAHDKDHYRLAYGEFVVPLVKAMQEQQKMIEDMKKEIEELKALIKASTEIQQKEKQSYKL